MSKITKIKVKKEGTFGEEMPFGVDASNVMLKEGKDLETKLKEFGSGGESLNIDSSTMISDFNDKKYFKSGIYRHSTAYRAEAPKNGPSYNTSHPGVLIVLEQGSDDDESAPAFYIQQIFVSNGSIYERVVSGYSMTSESPNASYGNWQQICPITQKVSSESTAQTQSQQNPNVIYYWAE